MGRNNNDWMQLLDVPLKLMEYQLEEKKAQAEMAQYQQTSALAQQKQNAENQINMMKQGYLPSQRPISQVPPGQYTELGGQGYRYNPNVGMRSPVFTYTPENGVQQIGTMPKNGKMIAPAMMQTPEQQGTIAGVKANATERAKAAANIPSAIRDLSVMNQQFNDAFPPTKGQENTPLVQRMVGVAKSWGVKTGIGVTPAQTGVLSAMPLASIGLVRLAGALGRVTNIELQMAEQALNQAGKTPDERWALTKTLATQYMSRVSPKEWNEILKSNPDLPSILKQYDIKPSQLSGETDKLTTLKSKYGLR